MNRLNSINNISMYLSRFVVQTRALNAINQYGINYIAETVLVPIFREVFGYRQLYNLNHTDNNFPGIDLGDTDAEIAFQISSTIDSSKVKETLDIFQKKQHYVQFKRLRFYCITEKSVGNNPAYTRTIAHDHFDFNPAEDVLDYRDLMRYIDRITDDETIQRIEILLRNQFSDTGAAVFQESFRPRVEFTAEIVFHTKINDYWLVELVAYVENKGQVQHRMYKFEFNLYGVRRDTNLEVSQNPQDRGQAAFPETLIPNGEGIFLPVDAEYFFIEPGIKGKYSYLTRVHESMAALSFHTWFDYPFTKEWHIAEAAATVPDK